MDIKFDYDDILIKPSDVSTINSRSEVNIFDERGMLPLITAPMDTVVSTNNFDIFNNNLIYSIIPRQQYTYREYYSSNPYNFYSYGLDDFKTIFLDNSVDDTKPIYALIDVANGHMFKLHKMVNEAKNKYGDQLVLMAGNVASPEGYKALSEAGADMIRCGIGNGNSCSTSQNTGIGYPSGSLIREIKEISLKMSNPATIIADGGIKKYADIIKALYLGADMVMIGSLFNKALESCGGDYVKEDSEKIQFTSFKDYTNRIGNDTFGRLGKISLEDLMKCGQLFKKFRGMSTKDAQKSLGREILKTSEGVIRYNKVEYTLSGWVENFSDYLKSAMSYTNSLNLDDFRSVCDYVPITQNALTRFSK